MKYAIFRRDPRAQVLIDDSTGFRAVLVPATVEIREDIAAELPCSPCHTRKARDGHTQSTMSICGLWLAEGRVLLAITPDEPPLSSTRRGLD